MSFLGPGFPKQQQSSMPHTRLSSPTCGPHSCDLLACVYGDVSAIGPHHSTGHVQGPNYKTLVHTTKIRIEMFLASSILDNNSHWEIMLDKSSSMTCRMAQDPLQVIYETGEFLHNIHQQRNDVAILWIPAYFHPKYFAHFWTLDTYGISMEAP